MWPCVATSPNAIWVTGEESMMRRREEKRTSATAGNKMSLAPSVPRVRSWEVWTSYQSKCWIFSIPRGSSWQVTSPFFHKAPVQRRWRWIESSILENGPGRYEETGNQMRSRSSWRHQPVPSNKVSWRSVGGISCCLFFCCVVHHRSSSTHLTAGHRKTHHAN